MTDLSIEERLYKRVFHSEQDRQREIMRRATSIEKDIVAALMKNDSEALEIAGDILGTTEPEVMMHMMRCALRGDISGANISRQLLLAEIDDSVKRTAEHRAIKQVEELTPNEYFP